MQEHQKYIGNELEIFSHAKNWKNYWSGKVLPYLGENVLEVGAGMGSNTRNFINNKNIKKWVSIEPDLELSRKIESNLKNEKGFNKLEVIPSFLTNYQTNIKFDSVMYIDVIEHIEKDKDELITAISYLKEGGYLIVLVPAYNFLYNDFDKAIGHYRRYSRKLLRNTIPAGLKVISHYNLDSLGLLASVTNKLFLKQSYPTINQIKFWDSFIVSLSRVIDPLLFYKVGKSNLIICKK
ncbi:MAG TPA: methyltransferase domain-containing protein [Segetibacter sp.]|nr:methyltransferase domain-containing protein [Segetibacter sp.]